MDPIRNMLALVSERLRSIAAANAVVAKPVSVGDRHVVPLCELGFSVGGAGGQGEGEPDGGKGGVGLGGGAGGGAKASPVAVVIVEGDQVRLEKLGN